MDSVKRYREMETKDGKQKTNQLDNTQVQGLKSVEEKVKKGVLHISPSDKGKRLVVINGDTYNTMTKTHVEGDIQTGRNN